MDLSFFSTLDGILANHSIPRETIKEQHHQLIAPMFLELSPVLFRNDLDPLTKADKIEKCYAIFSKNSALADAELMVLFGNFKLNAVDQFDLDRL